MEKTVRALWLIVFIFILSIYGYAVEYYVDGANGNDSANGLSLATAWKTVKKANQTLQAGDTVYIRGGTYTLTSSEDAIAPVNSGTPGNMIRYLSYGNEDVIFENGYRAINIIIGRDRGGSDNKRSYIKVSGSQGHPMTFNRFDRHLWIVKSDHNEIAYCTFFDRIKSGSVYQGTYIYINAAYNWIHHCVFNRWGKCAPYGTDEGNTFQMGINDADDHGTQYNLVENNEMMSGGHLVAWLGGTYNIYRNNYFHNEPWFPINNPTFATRVLTQNGYAVGGDTIDGVHNLNEKNRIGYGGPKNKDEVGGNVAQVMGAHNIWRYNTWVQSYCSSIWLYNYMQYGEVTKYNHIYNNTFWKGGYGYYQDWFDPRHTAPTSSWARSMHHPINIADSKTIACNTFKNNLFYQNNTNGTYSIGGYYDFVTSQIDQYSSIGPDRQNISHNWTDDMGDPKFVDISATADPTIDPDILWNFNLQSSSNAKDGGTYIAKANGAGSNSTTLVLQTETKDPYPASIFFYDAGNIASVWPAANLSSDWIAIGSTFNVVQISSINYSTNTITLASPRTWNNGDSIWLYKKSDGQVVLYGSAPDYGAYEYIADGNESQRFSLVPGWNWISFNVLPADRSLGSVFSGISSQVDQVKSQTQSAIYQNGTWIGDLADMNGMTTGAMYKVKVNAACTLTVTGTRIAANTPISLVAGWNWVAYYPETALDIGIALASITGQVLEVRSSTQAATYSDGAWSGTLTQLEPGKGYAIRMSSAGTLIYPTGD